MNINRKKHILIVEDDSSTKALYTSILSENYRLSSVSTVEDAKEIIENEPFDLVIVDIGLPRELNGIDLIVYIRQNNQPRRLSILTITAHASHQTRLDSIAAGSDEFLSKPVHPNDLIAAVEHQLEST
jgi:DNA-binding response OmpR family regulator